MITLIDLTRIEDAPSHGLSLFQEPEKEQIELLY